MRDTLSRSSCRQRRGRNLQYDLQLLEGKSRGFLHSFVAVVIAEAVMTSEDLRNPAAHLKSLVTHKK